LTTTLMAVIIIKRY